MAPLRPRAGSPACDEFGGGWGDSTVLDQGSAAIMSCHTDSEFDPNLPVLDYGETRSIGPITCRSEPSGITCTDSTTGHDFRIARDSYELH